MSSKEQVVRFTVKVGEPVEISGRGWMSARHYAGRARGNRIGLKFRKATPDTTIRFGKRAIDVATEPLK